MNNTLIFADEIKVGDTIRREKATKNYSNDTEYPNPWYTVTKVRTSQYGGDRFGLKDTLVSISIHTIGVDDNGKQVANTTVSTYVWERKEPIERNASEETPYEEYLRTLGYTDVTGGIFNVRDCEFRTYNRA